MDVTKLVREGENLVAVRVKNDLVPNSRWYSGSGIYRDVYLVRTNEIHFDHFGVRCATNGIYPKQDTALLQIRAQVVNYGSTAENVGVLHKIYDRDGSLFPPQGLHCILSRVKAATAWYVRLWKHLIYGRMRILICIPW